MTTRPPLLLLVFAFGAAIAQEEPEEGCRGSSTYEESVCLSAKYKKIDADLNAAYRKALKSATHYGEENVQKLKDAQRKWIVYRDAACNAEFNLWGNGTGGPIAHRSCLIRLTRERSTHLRSTNRFFSD